MKIINLDKYIASNTKGLIGRDNGKLFYQKLLNDNIDLLEETSIIALKLPPRISLVNKSFFLGAFGDVVRALGSDTFLQKIKFDSRYPLIVSSLIDYVSFAE